MQDSSSTLPALAPPSARTAAGIIQQILEPISEETARFLKPVPLQPNDRLFIRLAEARSNSKQKFLVKTYAVMGDQRVTASWNARYKWIENVPEKHEAKLSEPGWWELAVTDVTALVINANWPENQIEFDDDDARTMYEFLIARFMRQTISSQQRAAFRLRGTVPQPPPGWLDHPMNKLAPYQMVGVVPMMFQQCAGLFAQQGTGKTPMAIARICNEARAFRQRNGPSQLFRVLVLCPKNVRHNWQAEIAKFATVPGKASVLHGGRAKRVEIITETIMVEDGDDSEFAVVIGSYEMLKRSWEEIQVIPWHLAVADESHMIKSARTARSKATHQLRETSEERLIMTGTPICNSLMDMYSQLEFLDEGMSGFSSYEAFRHFYGTWERSGQFDKLTGYQNVPFLQERIARLAFVIKKEEALPDLPEKSYSFRSVEMTPRQRERYIKLQTQLALEIEDGVSSDGKRMTAQHILVKLLRLAQITSGFYAWDATQDPETGEILVAKSIEREEPNPKIEELMDVVGGLGDKEKVIIWAHFIPDIEAISKRFAEAGIPHVTYTGSTSDEDRLEAIRRFNGLPATECRAFIGNPAAGGTGTNLWGYDPDSVSKGPSSHEMRASTHGLTSTMIDACGCSDDLETPQSKDHGCNVTTVVYFSQGWSMVARAQSEDRCHRRGTRHPVSYVDLVVPGTIDEEIRKRVLMKGIMALSVQDVREIMKWVLKTAPEEE